MGKSRREAAVSRRCDLRAVWPSQLRPGLGHGARFSLGWTISRRCEERIAGCAAAWGLSWDWGVSSPVWGFLRMDRREGFSR